MGRYRPFRRRSSRVFSAPQNSPQSFGIPREVKNEGKNDFMLVNAIIDAVRKALEHVAAKIPIHFAVNQRIGFYPLN
jgi:hypothetical protein